MSEAFPPHADWRLVPIDYRPEASGTLGVVQTGKHVPFVVRRVFWLFGIPDETVRRGDHAHEVLQQVLYCASGRCLIDLEARDGTTATFELAQGGPGLFLNGPVWRTMHHFAPNTALIVLCDREYALDTVVRNRAEFKG